MRPQFLPRTAALTCALLLGLLGRASIPAARAQQPAPIPTDAMAAEPFKSWREPAEPLHIAGPIHFVGTKGLGAYLIATPAGHMLVGGGMPGSSEPILNAIRKAGFKLEDINILLSNHAHFDHVGTMADFKNQTGATVAVMDRDVDLLASGGQLDYLFANRKPYHFPPVKTDRVLKDGDTVELGGVTLKALLTPGHTRGCTTFTTTVQEGGRSYNVVFADGTGINAGTKFVHAPSYPGILDDYRRTFTTLESLKPDIFLAYHSEAFGLPEKRARAATEGVAAFVDSEGYRRFLAEKKASLEILVAKEQTDAAPK